MLERGEPALLEQPAQTVPQLIKVFAAILETDTVDEEVTKRVGAILRNLQQPPYGEVSTAAFQALPPDGQAKLQKALAS